MANRKLAQYLVYNFYPDYYKIYDVKENIGALS
jgi:hypothetical protein